MGSGARWAEVERGARRGACATEDDGDVTSGSDRCPSRALGGDRTRSAAELWVAATGGMDRGRCGNTATTCSRSDRAGGAVEMASSIHSDFRRRHAARRAARIGSRQVLASGSRASRCGPNKSSVLSESMTRTRRQTPDELRPPDPITPEWLEGSRGLGAIRGRRRRDLVIAPRRAREERVPPFLKETGLWLGDCGVRDAAADRTNTARRRTAGGAQGKEIERPDSEGRWRSRFDRPKLWQRPDHHRLRRIEADGGTRTAGDHRRLRALRWRAADHRQKLFAASPCCHEV